MSEALRLAHELILAMRDTDEEHWDALEEAAAELRRLHAALAEPEQEPVAWVDPSWMNPETRTWESESFAPGPINGWSPLYTAPPQRKPLKLREIEKCIYDANNDPIVACRNVEAAHGIKGEA